MIANQDVKARRFRALHGEDAAVRGGVTAERHDRGAATEDIALQSLQTSRCRVSALARLVRLYRQLGMSLDQPLVAEYRHTGNRVPVLGVQETNVFRQVVETSVMTSEQSIVKRNCDAAVTVLDPPEIRALHRTLLDRYVVLLAGAVVPDGE